MYPRAYVRTPQPMDVRSHTPKRLDTYYIYIYIQYNRLDFEQRLSYTAVSNNKIWNLYPHVLEPKINQWTEKYK